MSVFRSLPDAWAIGQLFPIVPLHRLAEAPTVSGSLADLTCDSDGRVDHFIPFGRGAPRHTGGDRGRPVSCLPLHTLRDGETYLMAAFLVGAYQESLGSRGHNLFGSPAVASVSVAGGAADVAWRAGWRSENGGAADEGPRFELGDVIVSLNRGQTTADVLRDAGADPGVLLEWMQDGERDDDHAERLFARFEEVLFESGTYLESHSRWDM